MNNALAGADTDRGQDYSELGSFNSDSDYRSNCVQAVNTVLMDDNLDVNKYVIRHNNKHIKAHCRIQKINAAIYAFGIDARDDMRRGDDTVYLN